MYVDDIIITRNDVAMVQHFVDLVTQWFSIKDLKPLAYFPGIEVILAWKIE